MKLKITIPTIIFIITLACTAGAQSIPFSIKLYGGYSMFTPGSTPAPLNPQLFTANINSQASGSFSQGSMGSGAGFHVGGGIEKDLGNIFMVEIDADYLSGSTLNASSMTSSPNTNFENSTSKTSVLTIAPSLGIKMLRQQNYFIYSRAGLLIAVNTTYETNQENRSTSGGALTSTFKWTYNYGITPGMQAGVGANFKLSGNIRGFVEMTDNLLPVKPNTSLENAVAYNANGTVTVVNTTYQYKHGSSGSISYNFAPTYTNTTGNTTTTDYTYPNAQIQQHINSVVLNAGVFVDFK